MKLNAINKNTWIIIPGLNEEKYIGTVLRKVSKYTNNIIVIDDGSTDKMSQIAQKFTSHVLTHSINLGKGAALKTGCEYAFTKLKAQAVIFMDSDDQHDPEELGQFYFALKTSDVVFGVRSFNEKMPLIRIMMNRLASVVIFFLFGSYIPDIPSGYKAITKKAYKKLAWDSSDYSVEMEIASRTAKYKIPFTTVQIKTIYHDFDRGMTILDTLRMITKIVSWRISL
jgi:UDP-N-acetylglucosamine---dolichyl-phosphate N-acetylglucosaminyltransferase